MLRIVNADDSLAASRLVELLSPKSPWYRSLWSVGITLMLHELCEAASAQRSGVLSEASVRRLIATIVRTAGKDPALTDSEKAFLRDQIKEGGRPHGLAWEAIMQLRRQIEADYLKRWARVISAGHMTPERFARNIASHLLDLGFSDEYLHHLLKEQLFGHESELTLSEFCEYLDSLSKMEHAKTFEVLIAFGPSRIPLVNYPAEWLRPDAISRWLRENGYSTAHVRPTVGVVLAVIARDAYGAGRAAMATIDRLSARASIATGRTLPPLPQLWVKGFSDPLPFTQNSRGVRVEALSREQLVFANPKSSEVDAAIELLAHLENSSPPVAVAGGWAAIEGLLGEPGDRAAAADNLAALVACSFPRAELTALSYTLAAHSEAMKRELSKVNTNRDRAAMVAQWITERRAFDLPHTTDNAALHRLRNILAKPSPTLHDLEFSAADAFHRLYRQRNLILHGGISNSVALAGSLRTVSKLAGAGIDRVVHGVYVQGMRPLELVARAKLSITMITAASSVACVDLLERP